MGDLSTTLLLALTYPTATLIDTKKPHLSDCNPSGLRQSA